MKYLTKSRADLSRSTSNCLQQKTLQLSAPVGWGAFPSSAPPQSPDDEIAVPTQMSGHLGPERRPGVVGLYDLDLDRHVSWWFLVFVLLRPRLLFIMYIGISIIISLCIYLILSTYLSVHLPYLPIAISPILFVISPSISLFLHLYLSMSLYLILSRLILPCLIISYVWYFTLFTYMILQACIDLASSFHSMPEASEKRCQKVMPWTDAFVWEHSDGSWLWLL